MEKIKSLLQMRKRYFNNLQYLSLVWKTDLKFWWIEYVYFGPRSILMLDGRKREAWPLRAGTRLGYQASLLPLNNNGTSGTSWKI